MANRLTVIMIESPPATATEGQMAEKIVGNLIGRPGIDLTLVRSLSNSKKSSTDQLTINAVTGDVAVLDWQSPSSIVNSLNQIGFSGRRAAHPCDAGIAASSENERRIYAFDLNQFSDPAVLIDALDSLKSDREIRTFSIAPLQGPGAITPVANPPVSTISAAPKPSTTQAPHMNPEPIEQPGAEIDLDDLIDQLDRSDT